MNGKGSASNPSVIIIGTGFGGIGLAIKLKQAGFDRITLFEKAGDVGGVWRDNTYPGAACDVPSHLYSYSWEQDRGWANRYGKAEEIYRYLRHCADKYDIRPLVRLNTEIAGADFDEARGVWTVRTTTGETHEAQVLVSAVGQLNRPAYPKLKGLDRFKGKAFHSAHWDHDYGLEGKRIAVIGAGASAIQFVPEIAPRVAHLDLYQRSAPYVLPKPDREYPYFEKTLFRKLPLLQSLDRAWQYAYHEFRQLGFTNHINEMAVVEHIFQKHIRSIVKDNAFRHRLTPDYPIGCKRILISNHWYKALIRSNVEVVSQDIAEVLPTGIRSGDGTLREVDAIIYGTGFAATDFLAPMEIRGLGGTPLRQVWKDGAEAYLGLTVSGFPNLYMLYGPNTNLGHSSIVYMLESQFNYIVDGVKKLRDRGLRYLDLRADLQNEFNREVQERMKKTVWAAGCTSWYQTASGKNTNNWPGFTFEYRERTRRLDPNHYHVVAA